MAEEKKAKEEVIAYYRPQVEKLAAYIPWLTEKSGGGVSSEYHPEGGRTINFPVYDSTLLSFVKEVEQSVFLDKNYPYVYSRYGIRTAEDELALIRRTDIMHLSDLGGILSRYIITGRTKGRMWSEGVVNQVYLQAILRAKELIEFHTNDGKAR